MRSESAGLAAGTLRTALGQLPLEWQVNEVRRPLVVGIGGSPRSESSSDPALRFCLRTAEQAGADTQPYSGPALALPNV